jgi:hypothetical protein
VEETLNILVWGLVPQLPLRPSCIGIGDLLLAEPPRWGGAILGGLVAPLVEALREFLDLAALGGAVASLRMNRDDPGSVRCWCGRLPREFWPPAATATATGAPARGLSKPRFFLFLFLPLPGAVTLEPPVCVGPP